MRRIARDRLVVVARLEMVHRGLSLCLAIALASGAALALTAGEARADGAFTALARRVEQSAGPPPHVLPPPVNPAPRSAAATGAGWPAPPEVPDWTAERPRPVWIAARARAIVPAGPGEPLGPLPEHPVTDRPAPVWLHARH